MIGNDFVRSLAAEVLGAPLPRSDRAEEQRIQKKQSYHHLPPDPDDRPPLDDTDRNTDKIIKPGQEAVMTRDPQSEPHVQDIKNDPPPSKGTNQPWKRPGQTSQNPGEPEPAKPDLEKWHKTNTR